MMATFAAKPSLKVYDIGRSNVLPQVTDDCETVLSIQRPDSPTSCNAYVDKLFHHLYRLIRERDQCAEVSNKLYDE